MHIQRPTVIFSNQLEVLAEELGKRLWYQGGDPFALRSVFLPHYGMKSYLQKFFATTRSVASGVMYQGLWDGMKSFHKDFIFPSSLALSFAVEKALREVLLDEKEKELHQYLCGGEDEKKLQWIAQELASMFHMYAHFEPEAFRQWQESGYSWQQKVWYFVCQEHPSWSFLSDALRRDTKYKTQELHIFAFSYIPSHCYAFLCQFPVTFYFLSPCTMFWEDLCSDRERLYLEKKMEKGKVKLQVQKQLQFYLGNTHPILANFGRVGRVLLAQFGQKECFIEEKYRENFAPGVLGKLQKTLLHLEEVEEKTTCSSGEETIVCLSSTSRLREVEVLFQMLQNLMLQHRVEPNGVLVLVPNLQKYLPYIHMVFGSSSSHLDYAIHGLPSQGDGAIITRTFLSILDQRFSLDSVFAFLSIPCVACSWDIPLEDLGYFHDRLSQMYIRFGWNEEQQQAFCGHKTKGSWEEGFRRIGIVLSMEQNEEHSCIAWSQVETLGQIMQAVEHLYMQMKPICYGENMSFAQWSLLWEAFFLRYVDQEDMVLELQLLRQELSHMQDEVFSFASFRRALEGACSAKKHSFQGSHLQAVQFVSLEIGHAYPADIIAVLGCEEEMLSLSEKKNSFVISGRKQPTRAEELRYYFLELFLHARCCLVFSYVRVAEQDQKIQGPSCLIDEITSYLDSSFLFDTEPKVPSLRLMHHHPCLPFDRSYFSEKANTFGSEEAFSLAMAYYGEKRREPSFFLGECAVENMRSIDVSQLLDFAKNPLRFYCKEILGLSLPFSYKQDQDVFLSPFMKKQALEEMFFVGKAKNGAFPIGRWGRQAQAELQADKDMGEQSLRQWGIKKEEIFSIECIEGITIPQKERGRLLLPSIQVFVAEFGTVSVQGQIQYVSSQGIIFLQKQKPDYLTAMWPSILMFLYWADKMGWERQGLFLLDGTNLILQNIDSIVSLQAYLYWFFLAQQKPCLFPTEHFLSIDKKSVPNTGIWIDPYLSWVERRDGKIDWDREKTTWERVGKEAYASLIRCVTDEEV